MRITIDLSRSQYAELERAVARTGERNFTPTDWAREAVESVLASHRLPKVTTGRYGARLNDGVSEMVTHRVILPEAVCQS